MIKYFSIVLLLISIEIEGQGHYNVAFDTSYISAIMQENIIVNGALYGVGGAICSTGECGYLTKYNQNGEIIWVKEYPQIDINSSQVMHYRNNHFFITGRAKDSIATKTMVVDTFGNVLEEWNYSVEGAETNFSKEVHYDDDYFYIMTKEVIASKTCGALYKCDYTGNLLNRLVFPELKFTIPLAVRPYRGNLLISINHRFEESCPFGLDGIGPGATYLAEVDKETMTIIRDKLDVCYRSISNDIYVSPSSELIRTVVIRDSLQTGSEGSFGIIYYDESWNVEDIKVYPHEFAKGITNIKYTKTGNQYYSIQTENVEQSDGSSWPFADLIIQKWDASHSLLWEKRYYSHSKMKRLQARNFVIDEEGNLHIVGYVWPDFPSTATFDFWLFSVDADGCHNSDCRDEVNLDDLVNSQNVVSQESKILAYPNPVNEFLYIRNLASGAEVRIMDIYGNKVIDENYKSETGIDIREIPSGIYFIKFQGFQALRIIKI